MNPSRWAEQRMSPSHRQLGVQMRLGDLLGASAWERRIDKLGDGGRDPSSGPSGKERERRICCVAALLRRNDSQQDGQIRRHPKPKPSTCGFLRGDVRPPSDRYEKREILRRRSTGLTNAGSSPLWESSTPAAEKLGVRRAMPRALDIPSIELWIARLTRWGSPRPRTDLALEIPVCPVCCGTSPGIS